jgi:hypothetical protein
MTKIIDVEGIGEVYAKKLTDVGVATTEDLLEKGANPKGRKEIADKAGISDKLILKWLNRADLARIKGLALNMPTCWRPRGSILSLSWPSVSRPT